MASISTDKNGKMRIKFYDENKQQKSLRLGKLDKRSAAMLCEDVEEILAARKSGQPLHRVTADRIGKLGPQFRVKFERAGLLEPVAAAQPKMALAAFLGDYIDGREDLRVSTQDNLRQAQRALVEYFGADKPLDAITPGDADEFFVWLSTKRKRPLALNTAKRLCSRAKQFFRRALRKKLISENPFGDMKRLQVSGGGDRQRFISREVIAKVLAACPNSDWRLFVVLCRYGGMRPSEVCNLHWEHVDWEKQVIRVRCEKTEHHAGRGWREVPFFPEIVPHLQESRDVAPEGSDMVIHRYRSNRNLRKPFQDMLRKAGIEVWPKPFQNMRSTRATELARKHAMHVVCSWLGNTKAVADEHYLQVTPEDHLRAVTERDDAGGSRSAITHPSATGASGAKRGPKSGPAHTGMKRQQRHRANSPSETNAGIAALDAGCRSSAPRSTSAEGKPNSPSRIRTNQDSTAESPLAEADGPKTGPVGMERNPPAPRGVGSDLKALALQLAALSEADREALRAMLEAVQGERK